MKTLRNILILIFAFGLFSFKHPNSTVKVGTYGICNNTGNVKVELTLNKDNTFTYYNNSNPRNIVEVKGNWVQKNNQINLINFNSAAKIPSKWIIDKNNLCIKSRKGLEFSRICKCN